VRPWIEMAMNLRVHSLPPHPATGYQWEQVNWARNEALLGNMPARQALEEATRRVRSRLDEILERGSVW